ncbi:class I adenylate-forming enzyme family protein [Dialister sp.]|uniref:class I adenylate-forming enzyme family protein n=1 Tax=Dialister sp. TaxID=1955814 RepID=UPI003F0B6029
MFLHEMIKGADPAHYVFEGERSVTYGELEQALRRYRNCLYDMGVRKGYRVALYSANRPEFVYVYLAVVSLGAIIIPVNNSLVDREVDYIIKDSGAMLLVTDTALEVSCPSIDIHDLDFRAEEDTCPEAPAFPKEFTEDDVCALVYTSGTTGSPKGAMLTHRNLVSNVEQFISRIVFKAEDKVLCVLPMFHCYGLTTVVNAGLYAHSTIVILRSRSPTEIINAIVHHSVTIAIMVPPMYNLLARRGEPSVMKTVHAFISGGASIPQPVSQAFYFRFHHPIQEGYGLTEASPVVCVLPSAKPKYLTSGPVLPGVEAYIRTEGGGPYVPGTVGELMVRGSNVMKGYWNKPEETKKVLSEDGWLSTGDLAYMDADQYIYIVDRIKDLIIVNGENIYPGEVEDCIYEVEGVAECAVVGHPDPLRGQAVWAYIVMKDGYDFDENKLRKHMSKNIASYKIPRRFIPMDALPKNATGKILKRALRDN